MTQEQYKNDRAQIYNPVIKKWVVFDTKIGGAVERSTEKFKDIAVYKRKNR